jgi:hypothetical protein
MACTAWLASASLRGHQEIYQPGPLSTVHQMLSNDCSQCHNKWAALGRLTSLSDSVRSVPNKKCETCHSGTAHQTNQIPAHSKIKCSSCHDEHRGDVQLTHIANQHCIECHSDLTEHGGAKNFALRIDSFDGSVGSAHPEFAIHQKGTSTARSKLVAAIINSKPIECPPSSNKHGRITLAQNPDSAHIRFNHQAHLAPEFDSVDGNRRNPKAFLHSSGQKLVCNSCHQLDSAGRYMLPIQYEQHCATCHPLLFDNDNDPGMSVPHEAPCIIRGFLTERYTLDAIRRSTLKDTKLRSALDPGSPYRGLLREDLVDEVNQSVLTAEKQVRQHMHTLFGWEAAGGCRYCHNVVESDENQTWGIVPPEIPDRWYPNSRFRHDSHRMLDCNACHRDFSQSAAGTPVSQSEETTDVLVPPISICLKCHNSQPVGGKNLSVKKIFTGARTNCVECHTYHKRDGTSHTGTLGLDLQQIKEHR